MADMASRECPWCQSQVSFVVEWPLVECLTCKHLYELDQTVEQPKGQAKIIKFRPKPK